MFFISDAFAQSAAGAAGESPFMNILPLVLIFAVFYLFLIRPQQKKIKEHQALVNNVQKGDEIVTGGGILATVTKVQEGTNIVEAKIADGVVVKINRATIVEVLNKTAASDEKSKSSSKDNKDNDAITSAKSDSKTDDSLSATKTKSRSKKA